MASAAAASTVKVIRYNSFQQLFKHFRNVPQEAAEAEAGG